MFAQCSTGWHRQICSCRCIGEKHAQKQTCACHPAKQRAAGFSPRGRGPTEILLTFLLFASPLLAADEPTSQPGFLKRQQVLPLTPAPTVSDIKTVTIHYDKNTYCGHPREIVFQYFGKGEILLGHYHAPCRYQVYEDVRHICYQSRSVSYLQRSLDYGKTWPKENDSIVFENTMPAEQKQALFDQPDAPRENYDMFSPESVFYFGRTRFSPDHIVSALCYSYRSPNKGYTWEKVPTVVRHPAGKKLPTHRHNTPVIRMPDGKTLLAGFQMPDPATREWEGDAAIFTSTDQGLTWKYLSRPAVNPSQEGNFVYVSPLLLPNGDLHCYCVHLEGDSITVDGLRGAMCLTVSKDGGKTWTLPVPIVGKGAGLWKDGDKEDPNGHRYRSPYPIMLKDGRILVMFGRRHMPGGIGGIVSSDNGQTWSEEFVIRNDAEWWDVGYPVVCEFEDGTIFTAYYWPIQDGNKWGGTRAILGTTFKLSK